MNKKLSLFNLLADSDGLTLDIGEAAEDVLPYADTVVSDGPGEGAATLQVEIRVRSKRQEKRLRKLLLACLFYQPRLLFSTCCKTF